MKDLPRRRTPRTMETVLRGVMADLAPTDPLSRLQAAWPDVAGARDAEFSEPRRQLGDGTIVIRCESAALAAELALRERQLIALTEDLTELRIKLRFEGPRGRR